MYGQSTLPKYFIKELKVNELGDAQKKYSSLKISTIEGSSNFRIMIFQPGEKTFKAVNRLCTCTNCKNMYGSCGKFNEYCLNVTNLCNPYLRSAIVP